MTKILLTGFFEVPAADLAAVRAGLPDHIAATRAEAGCLVFKANEDPEHVGRFTVYEEFVDQGALDQHQVRSKASVWAELCQNAERCFEVKEVPA